MAEALARAGAAVVIGDIREELGEATADAIKKSGAQAAFLPLDVTDDASWERAISGAIAELGGLGHRGQQRRRRDFQPGHRP
jgi:NAD(P)-dependent dehydrogenase (short-subunit alcohol dehydrogenase family)